MPDFFAYLIGLFAQKMIFWQKPLFLASTFYNCCLYNKRPLGNFLKGLLHIFEMQRFINDRQYRNATGALAKVKVSYYARIIYFGFILQVKFCWNVLTRL